LPKGDEVMTDEQILRACGLEPLKQFASRKNHVYRVCGPEGFLVAKVFTPKKAGICAQEFVFLNQARQGGVLVPQPLNILEERILLLEELEGESLGDFLNRTLSLKIAAAAGYWLAALHRLSGPPGQSLLKGDCTLRNFLVLEQQSVAGLDFEEAHFGRPVEDLGEICASVLATDPMFTPAKGNLCRRLVEAYAEKAERASLAGLEQEVAASLKRFAAYRPHQANLLQRKAREILLGGLP